MIYLDYNATSLVRPGVAQEVVAAMTGQSGNPSSVHGPGRMARQNLDGARRSVAELVGVRESQVIFTSGGTEANHLALFGMAAVRGFQGTLVTSAVEHPSILQTCDRLSQRGMKVIRLAVDAHGRVDPDEVAAVVDGHTVLVSIMAANNETGVLQPVQEIGVVCQLAGVALHTDATQYAGKMPLSLEGLRVNLLTLAAHKLGGPKGVGALILESSIGLEAQLVGGGQERGRRAGTENLPGIVGFGAAARLVQSGLDAERATIQALRDHLETGLLATIPDLVIFGAHAPRLPNTTAVGLPGLDGETLVMTLDLAGFAISSGSACSSGKTHPSHVLQAMGVEASLSQSAVRISLGWDSTREGVDRFVMAFSRSVDRLRQGSPIA